MAPRAAGVSGRHPEVVGVNLTRSSSGLAINVLTNVLTVMKRIQLEIDMGVRAVIARSSIPRDLIAEVCDAHYDEMVRSEIAQLKAFWVKVADALSRLAALAIFLLAHKLVGAGLRWVVPTYMNGMVKFIESIVAILFAFVYVYLCWDMVTVFVPKLRSQWQK